MTSGSGSSASRAMGRVVHHRIGMKRHAGGSTMCVLRVVGRVVALCGGEEVPPP